MTVRELQERLRTEYGSEADQALKEFRATGEVPADADPAIADELNHVVSTFGAPAVEEAIDKLAA